MLTKRQNEILLNLFSNLDAPVSLQVFTDQFHLSIRSIQTDPVFLLIHHIYH